jgi:tryptophan synthase beta chain
LAIGYLKKFADEVKNKIVIVNISGRGDKDMIQAKEMLQEII